MKLNWGRNLWVLPKITIKSRQKSPVSRAIARNLSNATTLWLPMAQKVWLHLLWSSGVDICVARPFSTHDRSLILRRNEGSRSIVDRQRWSTRIQQRSKSIWKYWVPHLTNKLSGFSTGIDGVILLKPRTWRISSLLFDSANVNIAHPWNLSTQRPSSICNPLGRLFQRVYRWTLLEPSICLIRSLGVMISNWKM